jgi:diguanylate cyclase (GGDEF)-like protein/PAS domain S-box-containing protein
LASYSDITERKQAEERLALAGLVFETTTEGVVITDAANRIVSVNPAFEQITGYRAQDVLGRDPSLLASGRQGAAFYETMWQALDQHGCWRGEIWNRRKDGEVYLEQLSIAVVRDRRGKIKRYVALLQDITEQNRQHEQMRHRAYHDALTDLPNRMLLGDRLQQALRQARRDQGQVAVLLIDLDGFKGINDTLGHQAGDALLVEIAHRLRAQVRETDTVARLGGDEFTIVLPEVEGTPGAERVARAVCAAVAEPVALEVDGVAVAGKVSASLGIALYPGHARSEEELLRLADAALYAVKDTGRNGYRFAEAAGTVTGEAD